MIDSDLTLPPPRQVLLDPQDDYTKELLTAIPHPPLQTLGAH